MKKKKKVKEKRKKVWIPNYLALWDWGPRPWAGSWDPPFGMLSDLPKLEVWGLSSPLYSGPIMAARLILRLIWVMGSCTMV